MKDALKHLLDKLSIQKKELDSLRPLSKSALEKLKEYYDVEWTYNSNAIEGNTLSLGETRLVILEGVTIGGKSMKEHLEAINHKKAIDHLESIVKDGKITENLLKKFHDIILKEIDDENAGKYRKGQVYISGSRYIPPHALSVPILMGSFVKDLNNRLKSKEHPAITASDAHYEIARIHPFIDGNGRLARLIMNLILMRAGYPPAIIQFSQREGYIKSLEKANFGDKEDFYILIAEACEASLIKYIKAIK